MNPGYIISPSARRDLKKIWTYSATNWDVDQADLYLSRLHHSIQSLAFRPSLGRACDDIRAGYYKYISGTHHIFYRINDTGIDIVRILHERMDFGQHL